MVWLLTFAVVAGLLAGRRYKAPAMIAGSVVVAAVGLELDLAWWQLLACLMTLQLSYFMVIVIYTPRR